MKITNNTEYENLTNVQNKLQDALDALDTNSTTPELPKVTWTILQEAIDEIHSARTRYDKERLNQIKGK